MKRYKVFHVEPVAKPRMTIRDRWKKRPCVMRYFGFRDEIRYQLHGWEMPEHDVRIVFWVPLPKQPNKSRRQIAGYPHRQKPDGDNFLKGFLDAVMVEDCTVWDVRVTKKWSKEGKIEVIW